jgi:predicted permease
MAPRRSAIGHVLFGVAVVVCVLAVPLLFYASLGLPHNEGHSLPEPDAWIQFAFAFAVFPCAALAAWCARRVNDRGDSPVGAILALTAAAVAFGGWVAVFLDWS